MNEKLTKLKPIGLSIGTYVFNRRGRFSAAGTLIVLYPWLRRPHHTWTEFEKDFRMYDQVNKKKQAKK